MIIFFRDSPEITPNLSSTQNKQIQRTAKITKAVVLVRAVGNRSPMKDRKTTIWSTIEVPGKTKGQQKLKIQIFNGIYTALVENK